MKKTVSLLIALLLILAVGCSTPAATPAPSATSAAPANTGAAASAAPSTPAPVEPSEPIDIEFFWREGGDIQVPEDSYIVQKLLEDINVNYIHLTPAGGLSQEEFIQLRFTSKEVPDIMESYSQQTVNFRGMGAIMELTDYVNNIDQYLPYVKRNLLNWDLGVELVTNADGEIWELPVTNASDMQAQCYIRYDWLENLGLQPPTTVEELAEVLVAFTNDDPDGDGKKNTYGTHISGMGGVAENMSASYDQWYSDGAGGLIPGFMRTEYKEYHKYLKDLIDRGGIFNEIADTGTRDETMAEKIKAGEVGFSFAWIGGADDILEMRKIYPEADWRVLTPPKGVFDQGYRPSGGVLRQTYVISAFSEDKLDAIWRLLDYMAHDDSTGDTIDFDSPYWEVSYGQRGVNWDYIDGVFFAATTPHPDYSWTDPIAVNNEAARYNTNCRRWRTVNSFAAARTGWSEFNQAAFAEAETWPTTVRLRQEKFGVDPLVSIYLEGVELPEEVNIFMNEWISTQKLETYRINWLLGRRDIDQDFEAMLAEAETDNFSQVKQIMDDYLKSIGKL